MDKDNFTGIVLLDLKKAFDTVDHTILLSKLKEVGPHNAVLRWFSPYLDSRKQFVHV